MNHKIYDFNTPNYEDGLSASGIGQGGKLPFGEGVLDFV